MRDPIRQIALPNLKAEKKVEKAQKLIGVEDFSD
tara:strand:+ start:137 stop:238 length:102 start_codon:yes stop_codon:yes gene_type:complete